MKIGINGTGLVATADVSRIVEHAAAAQVDGFTSYALAEHPTGGSMRSPPYVLLVSRCRTSSWPRPLCPLCRVTP